MLTRVLTVTIAAAVALCAQPSPLINAAPEVSKPAAAAPAAAIIAAAPAEQKPEKGFDVDPGTRIPLSMINSVSTKYATPGDRVYLETAFPVVVGGRIVIPAGSYVMGTITSTKRPGKVKGRGEF